MVDILLDNIIYSLQHGGGASVVWTEHINRLLKDPRFSVRFIEYDGAESNVFRKDVCIPSGSLEIKSNTLLALKRYLDLKSERNQPYIFHSSHYRIDNCPFAKNVTTVHDFVYEKYVGGIRKRIHSAQKWNSIRKADLVICISESTKRDLLSYLPDVDEKKIVVIHHGVDETYHPISKESYLMDIPFSTGEYVLYIGNRLAEYKNFNLVVDVCAKMRLPLIMVGGEPILSDEEVRLKAKLHSIGYAHYRGISNKELNELYNRARVFLYPSLYEGFGIPVIEAQRAGTPVICLNSSSIPEIVGDSNLCITEASLPIVCDLIKALEDSSFRYNEVEKGLRNSQRFSWSNTYQKTTAAYLSLFE